MLVVEKVLRELRSGGLLSFAIQGYEERAAQIGMAEDVCRAYNDESIALIEAGTGTGKSIAYLVPAILWAAQSGERTVISTHTIHLQEQLLHKDIPFLLKIFKLDLKVSLLKGMNNYVCLRKVDDCKEDEEVQKIIKCRAETRADLPFTPTRELWEQVGAEHESCSQKSCPHYKECHFFKARKEAQDAQILIVNHYLLTADLMSEEGVLPPFKRLVIDEAHHLEDVATENLAAKVSFADLERLCRRLFGEGIRPGKLSQLYKLLDDPKPSDALRTILSQIELDLAGYKMHLHYLIHEAFTALRQFVAKAHGRGEEEGPEHKLRLIPKVRTQPFWNQQVIPKVKELFESLRKLSHSLVHLEEDIKALKNEKLLERCKSVRLDLMGLSMQLDQSAAVLEAWISSKENPDFVRWAEVSRSVKLIEAQLDVSKRLKEKLFDPLQTAILCSATLSTSKKFNFIKQRLGIDEEAIEKIYESPFDFAKQALLVVPKGMPDPKEREFLDAAGEKIFLAVKTCGGQAFVLFTSFEMMHQMLQKIHVKLENSGFTLMVHGEKPRRALLESFKASKRAILFGTNSFWEGVDVVGEALRCVILVKLPFRVPTEPIVEARLEAITAAGGDSFMDYMVPHAVVRFKQGFGRLIRTTQDRGCVLCLDTRLYKKGYGKIFLNSLPPCGRLFEESIEQEMHQFYTK